MWKRLAFALCLSVAGCGGGDDNANPDGPGSGPTDMGPSDSVADGGGCPSTSAHQALLVAPTTAVVVRKTPAHPPVGDGGLP